MDHSGSITRAVPFERAWGALRDCDLLAQTFVENCYLSYDPYFDPYFAATHVTKSGAAAGAISALL